MATSTGKVFVDVYAQTAPAEKALQRIQKIANTPLNLNLKGGTYTGPLGKITGQVGEFDKSLEAANARVIAFGASAGIIYNAGKAFEYLVKTTIEVEKRLNDIKVILNTNTQAFSEFSSELFNIANRTGQTFNVATDAALELARQGLGLETTLKRTAAALSLTRISGLEVTKSVEAITAAINSFNKSAIDEINLVSKLSNVDTQFAVSSQDLAEALTRVGSTAQDAGVSIDELIGLVTAVQQTTSRGGPVIGNAFKTIFTRLSNSNTIEQLKALGVQIDETQSGLDKLRAISDAVKNVDESQANTIKRLAAGVYQINILSAVLSDLSNKYSIVSQAQNTATQSTNESEVRIRNLNKTLNGLINETINNFARLTSQIGENAVLPNADNFLRGINSAILTLTKDDASDAGFNFADAFFKGFGQVAFHQT
jgi:TP901 family phage tail tape measure protein